MTAYALASEGQVGKYPTEPTLAAALTRAFEATELGVTVTIFVISGGAVPLCTVSPPITPTHSTSPGGNRE